MPVEVLVRKFLFTNRDGSLFQSAGDSPLAYLCGHVVLP